MRTAWNTVSFLAVVHLLALAMFVGWLWNSKRLDGQRLIAVRDVLAVTIPQERAAAAEAAAEVQAQRKRLEEQERVSDPPITSAAAVRVAADREDVNRQLGGRVAHEAKLLRERLAQQGQELSRREAEFEARQQAWREAVQDEQRRRSDEQFAKAVKQLESLKPKQAKTMIVQLIKDGKMEQAVAYLDAMNRRAASKLLNELKTDQESQLATELLERLRTFGLGADAAGVSGNADAAQ